MQYEEAVSDYLWIKEHIKYYFPYWGDTTRTLAKMRGHCGMKAELLASSLKARGIETRYAGGKIPRSRAGPFYIMHFWVEAKVDGQWLTLDPTPDSGITDWLGDTKPGTHLETHEHITRWGEIPVKYKKLYNRLPVILLRWIFNIKLAYHRKRRNHKNSLQKNPKGVRPNSLQSRQC